MKLGLAVGYWGLGLSSEDQLALVRAAEESGWDSVWAAEAYGSDTATVLAWLASQTSRIKIGSGIFQMPGRSPAATCRSSSRPSARPTLARCSRRARRAAAARSTDSTSRRP